MFMQKVEQLYSNNPDANLNFINTAIESLPIDENPNNEIREVPGVNYSKVLPTLVQNPRIGSLSSSCLQLIGLSKEKILSSEENKKEFAELLSGNKLFKGSIPISHNYCGHQFGVFAGQLGDGRAITIGDVRNQKGELWELQLKGSGQTPYSRFADGRAVLRSSIREYLCSEALYFLGIPTSRAASLIVSDTKVQRDPIYSGNVIYEKCAIVLRIAPTFFRFGSFEIFKELDYYSGSKGPSVGLKDKMMPQMLNYVIRNHFPEINSKFNDINQKYQEFFKEVVSRTTKLASLWQCNGYCHGVLNTDNMSIQGLTIDYGPYAFMEHFNPKFICNYSDSEGRYSYENQPKMVKWNLMKLAEALNPIIDIGFSKKYVEEKFDQIYSASYLGHMAKKLGFITYHNKDKVELNDVEYDCVTEIFEVMKMCGSDFTNTFRTLSNITRDKQITEQDQLAIDLIISYSAPAEALHIKKKPKYSGSMLIQLKKILEENPEILHVFGINPEEARREIMQSEDNYKVQDLTTEDQYKQSREAWEKWITLYKTALSSMDQAITDDKRRESMNKVNPKFILRNYLMEEAIKQADKYEDYSKVDKFLQLATDPYNENATANEYAKVPPKWAFDICISCSS